MSAIFMRTAITLVDAWISRCQFMAPLPDATVFAGTVRNMQTAGQFVALAGGPIYRYRLSLDVVLNQMLPQEMIFTPYLALPKREFAGRSVAALRIARILSAAQSRTGKHLDDPRLPTATLTHVNCRGAPRNIV